MRGLLFILAILFIFMMPSCKLYSDVVFNGVKSTKFGQIDKHGVTCDIVVELYNPNPYRITLLDSDVEISLEGQKLGHVELPTSAVLEAESKSQITMRCAVPTASIPAIAGSAIGLIFKKDLILAGKGTLRAKALLISKSFPIEFQQTITKDDLGIGF